MKRLVFTALLALTGCGPFWVDPYFTVRDSPLNWVEISYYNLGLKASDKSAVRRTWVRLSGTGLVEVRSGTSELVTNDFAKDYRSKEWANIRTSRINVDVGHINEIFQNLVNYGLMDREKTGKRTSEKVIDRFIAVKANISNNTYSEQENIFEVDPDLAEELLDVVRVFSR